MNWKFWQKKESTEPQTSKTPKPSKPKDLPSGVGRHIVVNLNYDPDWVWSLKCVKKLIQGRKHTFDFRVFEPSAALAKGVVVSDYNSLNVHVDLILFDGWFNDSSMEVSVADHKQTAA